VHHAFALLTVKGFDAGQRQLSGIAATPEPDRHGDLFDPLGATFRNPLPLLLHHDQRRVIGKAFLDPPTAAGLTFTAQIATVTEPGELQQRTDGAWQELNAGTLWGVSLGFAPVADGVKRLASGAYHFLKTEIIEVSLVSIPAHRGATVLTLKSLCGGTMTLSEQIAAVEQSRAIPAVRLGELAAAGLATTEARADFDRVELEVKSFDDQLTRLRRAEQMQSQTAAPIVTRAASTPAPRAIVTPNVEKGTAWVRYCMALAASRGDTMQAIARAAEWRDSTPEVELVLKAAIAPATTTDTAWAKPLVPTLGSMSGEFLELLMPATILGKLTGLFKVPFNISIPVELAGGSANWVGEGKPKPLTKFNYSAAALPMYKVAAIVTLTEELARSSSPSAEQVFRRRLIKVIAEFLDKQFLDPAVAEVAAVHPASITNGLVGTPATGDAAADLASLLMHFTTANMPLSDLALIMSEANAFALSMQKDRMGNALFPELNATGGEVYGIQTVVSQTAASLVVALAPGYILYADEGQTTVDVSREASLQMSDTPMDPADATTVYTSLWQNNLVGLRAERYIAWKRAVDAAVWYLTGAAWPVTAPVVTP